MASSVALINKDIARHYQLSNLLAPPEAIELTKLYNEMSDILSKPVKFRNQPMQLHLFYDLLSQYAKHLENVKLDGIPLSKIPKPPGKHSKDSGTQTLSEQESQPSNESGDLFVSDLDMTAIPPGSPIYQPQPVTSTPAAARPITPQKLQIVSSPKLKTTTSPISHILKELSANSETPKKIMSLLQKHDTTFRVFPDARKLIVEGKEVDGPEFVKLLETVRNPAFSHSGLERKEQFLLQSLTNILMKEDDRERLKILKKLPGLKYFITSKPSMETRSRPGAQRKIKIDETAVSGPVSNEPRKLTSKSATTKQGHGNKQKPSTVHWKKWQRHIKR
jgi:hypothetical protein